jgi:hypothetical protein
MINKTDKSKNTADMKMAQGLSASDKQILKDHAASLKQQGTPAAARELDRMNKMYRNYGMSFGSIKGA